MPGPSYGLTALTVIEMTLVIRYNLQTMMLIRHYQQDQDEGVDIPDGPGALTELALSWDDETEGITKRYSTFAYTEITFPYVRAQAIYPVRFAYRSYDPNWSGGNAEGVPLPQNVTGVISFRSDFTGPHSHGNSFITGLQTDHVEAGVLTEAGKLGLEVIAGTLLGPIVTTTTPATFYPIIFNRTTPTANQKITNAVIQDQSRVMRRRTVGLGI